MDADRWLERPGARLRWRMGGTGPTLLLIHGWALDLELFEPFVAATREHLRLLRFDRRGYGHSGGEPRLESDVEDAFALLDAADVGPCAVLGMSQGARVAGALARRQPARITRVILDGAPALRGLADDAHEPELPWERFRRLALTDPAALAAALARHPLLSLVQPTPETLALLDAQLARYPGNDLRAAPGHAAPPPTPADVAPFRQPVLVLNGDHDSPARLRIGARLVEALPDARQQQIPGAGHLACLDDPQAYAAAVRGFLARPSYAARKGSP